MNYSFWPRRCPVCGARRRLRVWLVEGLAIAITIWVWFNPPTRIGFWIGMVLLIYFGVVSIIDIEHRLILHKISFVGAVIGLVVGTWMHGLQATLIGGLAGFGIMLFFYLFGILMMKVLIRWRSGGDARTSEEVEALGFGDVNLGGVLGLILGWPGISAGLVLTFMIGAAVSLIYMIVMKLLNRYRSDMALPYGPFLIAGAFVLLFLRSFLFAN